MIDLCCCCYIALSRVSLIRNMAVCVAQAAKISGRLHRKQRDQYDEEYDAPKERKTKKNKTSEVVGFGNNLFQQSWDQKRRNKSSGQTTSGRKR